MKYIYTCPKHGDFEKEYKLGEAPKTTKCPNLRSIMICKHRCKRVYKPISVHYNAPGFYSKENKKK